MITDNYASGQPLLRIDVSSTGVFRLTGITVRSGSGSIKDGGTISIGGPGTMRIDHCHFIASSSANYKMVAFWSGFFGVMDHCILDLPVPTRSIFTTGDTAAGIWWEILNGLSRQILAALTTSTSRITSSRDMQPADTYGTRIFDGYTAAKVVVRFNTMCPKPSWARLMQQAMRGDDRGLRSQEIYGNEVTSSLARRSELLRRWT